MDKVVVVTGGTSGIGRQLVGVYKEHGFQVISLANRNDYKMENVILCDVSNDEEVKNAFAQIKEKYQKVDILVNCAGFGISGAMELTPYAKAQGIMDVNFMGVYNCTKYAMPLMPAGSNVVNISSTCALFALPFRGLYCASKSAVSMLTYCWRMEAEPFKVNVCSVCPGEVKTEFTANRVKNFDTNERYGQRVERAAHKVDSKQDSRMDPRMVAEKIVKFSLKKKPKPMKIISAKYKLLYFVSRFVPISWMLHFTNKFYGGQK